MIPTPIFATQILRKMIRFTAQDLIDLGGHASCQPSVSTNVHWGHAVAAGSGNIDMQVGRFDGAFYNIFLSENYTTPEDYMKISQSCGGSEWVSEVDVEWNSAFGGRLMAFDTNGDGVTDLSLLGNYGHDDGDDSCTYNCGVVWRFTYLQDGSVDDYEMIVHGEVSRGQLGAGVAHDDTLGGHGALVVGGDLPPSGYPQSNLFVYFLDKCGNIDATRPRVDISSGHADSSKKPGDAAIWSVISLGDIQQNGQRVIAVGQSSRDTVFLLSLNSATGQVEAQTEIPFVCPDRDGTCTFGHDMDAFDIDRDGVLDLIVGAPGDDNGAVYVLLMNRDLTVREEYSIRPTDSDYTDATGYRQEGIRFGHGVARIGQKNGSQILAAGSPGYSSQGYLNEGAAWIIFLKPTNKLLEPLLQDALGEVQGLTSTVWMARLKIEKATRNIQEALDSLTNRDPSETLEKLSAAMQALLNAKRKDENLDIEAIGHSLSKISRALSRQEIDRVEDAVRRANKSLRNGDISHDDGLYGPSTKKYNRSVDRVRRILCG